MIFLLPNAILTMIGQVIVHYRHFVMNFNRCLEILPVPDRIGGRRLPEKSLRSENPLPSVPTGV
jgi:hypothetical protein